MRPAGVLISAAQSGCRAQMRKRGKTGRNLPLKMVRLWRNNRPKIKKANTKATTWYILKTSKRLRLTRGFQPTIT